MFHLALPAGLALGLVAAGVRAEEPKARSADLEELKYAVTVADRRGDNVELIREALIAFEKATAKGATRPGSAPPELRALREAVEAAARKGENVEAISKELSAIEKALTGREYQRPKPPEPQPDPVPPLRPGRGGVVMGGGGRIVINGNGGFNATSITISNGNFTIKARQGEVNFTVTGSVFGAEAPKILIRNGDKKTETDDLKKVPEEYRPAVERLLKMVERG